MLKKVLFVGVSFLCLSAQAKDITESDVRKYLDEHPELVSKIVMERTQESNERAMRVLEAAVAIKNLEDHDDEGDKMIAELEDSGMINPRYTKQLKEAIEKKKNRVEEPLNMDCSDGIKITTNDVDNVRVSSCAAGYCNGRTFCKSKSILKWDEAVEWCHSHGGKLVEFDHLCPRPKNDTSPDGECSNLVGILDGDAWTNTPFISGQDLGYYYIFVNRNKIAYFTGANNNTKGYAVCENASNLKEALPNESKTEKVTPTEYAIGNPNGKFVIIAIFDYQCGWCKKSHEALQKMLQSEKAKDVKIVLAPYPIFGAVSEMSAKYVLAAAHQGKLTEMNHAVFTMDGKKDESTLLDIAQKLGLNTEQLKKDANGSAVEDALKKTKQRVRELGLNGVPAFIINGQIHRGAIIDQKAEEILNSL